MPNVVNFNGVSYNISTGGTLPIILNQGETYAFNTTSGSYGSWHGGIIPSRTKFQSRFPQPSGFSSNYTVTQQGFTVDVSCQAHDLSTLPLSYRVIPGCHY